MIAVWAVVSTMRAWLRRFLLLALPLAGCTGLPVYNPVLPPLPAVSLQADEVIAMPDGAQIPLREWLPPVCDRLGWKQPGRESPDQTCFDAPRAVILALHGFNDSRDAWELPGPA